MASTKLTSKQEEALQFLDDLDSFAPPPPVTASDGATASAPPPAPGEAAEVLAFLDEITQKSSEPPKSTASILAASTSRPPSTVPGGSPKPAIPAVRQSNESTRVSPIPRSRVPSAVSQPPESSPSLSSTASAWGWGSVWSTASSAIQQARTVADEQVKQLQQLQNSDQARKWGEGVIGYVKNANLDKLGEGLKTAGFSTFTEILNAVAPPIAEHEVIQVWLSHDMHGYDGVESLVYKSLAKVMEQVEGGDLVVNKGNESRPKESVATDEERNLHAVEGYDQALKLAQANLEDLIKAHSESPSATRSVTQQNPTTYSSVFLRIQPYFASLSAQPAGLSNATAADSPADASVTSASGTQRQLQFLLHLSDPTHTLLHTQITQAVPAEWLDIWDENEWVEDLVVDAIRLGIEIIGQEYVVARMGWIRRGAVPTSADETDKSV